MCRAQKYGCDVILIAVSKSRMWEALPGGPEEGMVLWLLNGGGGRGNLDRSVMYTNENCANDSKWEEHLHDPSIQ